MPQGIARDRDGQSILVEIGVGVVWLSASCCGETFRFPLARRDVERTMALLQAASVFAGEII